MNTDTNSVTPAVGGRSQSGASAAPTQPRKAKRTLGFDNLFKMLAAVLASSPVLLRALFRPKTSAALREKVMLGVTSVTDCRYCAWGHGHWAMANGVSLEEVNQILGQQTEALQASAPAEAAAILFAQHYAEHLEQFDPASIDEPAHTLQRRPGGRDPRLRAHGHPRRTDRQHARRVARSPAPDGPLAQADMTWRWQ